MASDNLNPEVIELKLGTLEILNKYERFINDVEKDLKTLNTIQEDLKKLTIQNDQLQTKLSKLENENKKLKNMKAYKYSRKYWNVRNKLKDGLKFK